MLPEIRYPADLPVVERREDIADAIANHQVVIVAGETGSGKTTQLPKILLELGRGREGMIGHTQPRRIAARSVAERIAEELGTELGHIVGYQVRFTDHSTASTMVKVMTDGILLAELQRDPELRKYDSIIIDEAHERSLNIDFLLGYLKQLLPRRPELKVVITSATIDPEKFAQHFALNGSPAPIIEVSGRTYPVEIRYRPLEREVPGKGADAPPQTVDIDQVAGIVDAVEELWTEAGTTGPQDILVFCSGEREIRDAADALAGLELPGTEVLPLYARLSSAEQHRVFSAHRGRRIVLATNVAETSLTVPGIRYVVDTGTARISRYSQRTKVQRLPIEPISQASAQQRSGRCGRLADGICIRLYSQEDFDARPAFTDPEILRTNLASVILQMISLRLGQIEKFPFVQPPDARQIADGLRLLGELQAVEPGRRNARLTAYGKKLARLPVDPRMARMLVAAADNGALREVLIIVSALSIQDVRERPADAQAQADQSHARFKHETSDFLTLLNLWNYLKDQQKALSSSAFRRMCKREYLHYLRVREWQDLHSQLRRAAKQAGLADSDNAASPDTVHQSLLAGLLSHVGLRDNDKRDYQGARNARFSIQPGSTLFRRQPDWLMSAELVETTRLWARVNAQVEPAWIERAAAHLVKRSYSEPHWERKQGGAVASERVTLYGIPLVVGRKVAFGRIDPAHARELFIRHALVDGDWETHHKFFEANRQLLRQVSNLEARARRRDLVVDDDALFDFYDQRIPENVVSARHFDRWWRDAHRQDPDQLTFRREQLLTADAEDIDVSDFPTNWRQGALKLRLSYQFEPGTDADGVTVHIPLSQLNQVTDDGFDWLVPGMRLELATALLKSLPKATRRNFVPTPDFAKTALAQADPQRGPITHELADQLRMRTGIAIPDGEWVWDRVPDHLRMTYRVEGGRGRAVAEGKDLAVLQEQLRGKVQGAVSQAAATIEQRDLTSWSFGELPAVFEQRDGRRTIKGFPAVVDRGESVAIQVLPTESERDAATKAGIRRLLLLNTEVPWKRTLGLLTNTQRLAMAHNPHGSMPALLDDVLAAAVDDIVRVDLPAGTVRNDTDFAEALRLVKQLVTPRVIEIVDLVVPILNNAGQIRLALDRATQASLATLTADLRTQYDALIFAGFVAAAGKQRLPDIDRYLRGMLERLDKAPAALARDVERSVQVQGVEDERRKLLAALPAHRHTDDDVVELRWLTEELRISLFAQRIGTKGSVSPQRIFKAMDAVEAASG